MARGRMLNKDISESDSFPALKDSDSQLLCVLLTPWWDDWGKMIGDEDWIKGNIVRKLPQFTLKNISRCLKNISEHIDVVWWTDEKTGNKYLYWAKFDVHEKINEAKRTKDHLPSPKLPQEIPGNLQENPGEHPSQVEVEVEVEVEEEEGKVAAPSAAYDKYLKAHGGHLNQILSEEIGLLIDTYGDQPVADAIVEAVRSGVARPPIKYLETMLSRWEKEGQKTQSASSRILEL